MLSGNYSIFFVRTIINYKQNTIAKNKFLEVNAYNQYVVAHDEEYAFENYGIFTENTIRC